MAIFRHAAAVARVLGPGCRRPPHGAASIRRIAPLPVRSLGVLCGHSTPSGAGGLGPSALRGAAQLLEPGSVFTSDITCVYSRDGRAECARAQDIQRAGSEAPADSLKETSLWLALGGGPEDGAARDRAELELVQLFEQLDWRTNPRVSLQTDLPEATPEAPEPYEKRFIDEIRSRGKLEPSLATILRHR